MIATPNAIWHTQLYCSVLLLRHRLQLCAQSAVCGRHNVSTYGPVSTAAAQYVYVCGAQRCGVTLSILPSAHSLARDKCQCTCCGPIGSVLWPDAGVRPSQWRADAWYAGRTVSIPCSPQARRWLCRERSAPVCVCPQAWGLAPTSLRGMMWPLPCARLSRRASVTLTQRTSIGACRGRGTHARTHSRPTCPLSTLRRARRGHPDIILILRAQKYKFTAL